MCEIGHFPAFTRLKQLFIYFGADPSVNESGHFKGPDNKMSKRGSRIARLVLYVGAPASIRTKRNRAAINNPMLYEYYQNKKQSKPKKVALGAIMHKISNIIFAVLRDKNNLYLRLPQSIS